MVRICAITSSFPRYAGDVATGPFVYELLQRSAKLGHSIQVIAPHQHRLKKLEKMGNLLVHRFTYMHPTYLQDLAYGHSIPENVKKNSQAVLQVLTYIFFGTIESLTVTRAFETDVVVPFWVLPQGLMGTVLKKLTRRPLIICAFPAELSLAARKYRLLVPLLCRIMNSADLIIANSDFTRRLVVSFGIPPAKVTTLYPGVDLARYRMQRGQAGRSAHLDKAPVILTVGRLVERKGIRYLIQAMPQILDSVPNATLTVVGDGPEKPNLERQAAALKLEKVQFLGRVTDKALLELYRTSDVFVLPAVVDSEGNTEGLGVVLLEAMAMGKPVVASRVGGIPEVVSGETGILVQPEDPSSLATAVVRLLLDRPLSTSMGQEGRLRVERVFDWDVIASRFTELIDPFDKHKSKAPDEFE